MLAHQEAAQDLVVETIIITATIGADVIGKIIIIMITDVIIEGGMMMMIDLEGREVGIDMSMIIIII